MRVIGLSKQHFQGLAFQDCLTLARQPYFLEGGKAYLEKIQSLCAPEAPVSLNMRVIYSAYMAVAHPAQIFPEDHGNPYTDMLKVASDCLVTQLDEITSAFIVEGATAATVLIPEVSNAFHATLVEYIRLFRLWINIDQEHLRAQIASVGQTVMEAGAQIDNMEPSQG
jgi:hypothetical protein